MEGIDGKVFVLIAAATVAVTGAVKKGWPGWAKGKEDFLNIVFPLTFVVIAKIAGFFAETDWVDALVWAFVAGPTAGLIHDKVINPVISSKVKEKLG